MRITRVFAREHPPVARGAEAVSGVPAWLAAVPCPHLNAALRYSQGALSELAATFAAQAASLADIETVAVGGSLGRLEAGLASDVDCIVVLRDGAPAATAAAQTALVHTLLATSPFKPPKADGIYRQAIARHSLLDASALGSLDEAPVVFGKRIQLLLDARPVFANAAFETLRRDVLAWYCRDFLTTRPARAWTYLCNDLMRYLHSYAGWQQFKFERSDDDSWQLRQAKFRSSRLLTFAAIMFLLGASDRRDDKVAWLEARLGGTPLERLFEVMSAYDAAAYGRLLAAYEATFALLTAPGARARLIATGPDAHSRMTAEFDPLFEDIRQASADLSRILTRFALAREGDWGARFFERWLF